MQMWQLRATKLSQDLANKQMVSSNSIQTQKEIEPEAYQVLLEEVEDLRYNYKECLRQNLRYEEQLKFK